MCNEMYCGTDGEPRYEKVDFLLFCNQYGKM